MKHPHTGLSRRDFVKGVGTLAGAASFDACATSSRATRASALSTSEPAPIFPELNERACGWLRFVWEKATTPDDWTSKGKPHPWWDQYTAPGVLSYPRFDLNESTYAVLMMADQTPAWREVYTRIMDGIAGRYPTHWGAVDWLTQIGDDPQRASYPTAVMSRLPPNLRGRYNRIGWVANGVAPYGLQPDPLGADGNLFFRGWLNLVLSAYKYVSGDDKWEKPFKVIGYQDREFEWSQRQIVERLERQWDAHPEGIHCENTKVWPYCLSAAGLGLLLYDKLHGTRSHRVYENWLEYWKANYRGLAPDGRIEWVTAYSDPSVNFQLKSNNVATGVATAFYMAPQNREVAASIYEAAAGQNHWTDDSAPLTALSIAALVMARELGDQAGMERLSAAAEREYEPRFFGDDSSRFGWWFKLAEQYPRGQRSALMMVTEVGKPGDWIRAFTVPHLDKFQAPTVEGVDYPALGISQAWNDEQRGTLHVGTYAASPDRRGLPVSWRVTGLPRSRGVTVRCDGEPFMRFEVISPNAIRIDSTIDTHKFQVVTSYRRLDGARPPERADVQPVSDRTTQRSSAASCADPADTMAAVVAPLANIPTCPCCAG